MKRLTNDYVDLEQGRIRDQSQNMWVDAQGAEWGSVSSSSRNGIRSEDWAVKTCHVIYIKGRF
jgi:hypothetical protein